MKLSVGSMQKVLCTCFILITVSGCSSVKVSANSQQRNDIDRVFGGVEVGQGATVRNVSSVNGGVSLKSESIARSVDTVNGGIKIGEKVTLRDAETVNGAISAQSKLIVDKGLATVNGDIDVGEQSKVGSHITTVNGDIRLKQVAVTGNVKTVNGDVRLREGTLVKGDLIIEYSDSTFGNWHFMGDPQEIEVDANSKVEGTIHLYKPVKLIIEDENSVGEIKRHYSQK